MPCCSFCLYTLITTAYSFYLKRIPILDVFVLACLFTLRLGFGIALAEVRLSPWLLVFSMFTFLSLSLAKRHIEIISIEEQANANARGYRGQDAPLGLGLGSLLGSVLIVILYLTEDAFSSFLLREAGLSLGDPWHNVLIFVQNMAVRTKKDVIG